MSYNVCVICFHWLWTSFRMGKSFKPRKICIWIITCIILLNMRMHICMYEYVWMCAFACVRVNAIQRYQDLFIFINVANKRHLACWLEYLHWLKVKSTQKTVKNRVWLCASCWFWCSMFGDDVVIFTKRLGCQFTIQFLSLSVLFFMILLQLGRLLWLSQEFLTQIFRFSFSPSSFHSNLSCDTQIEIYVSFDF